MAEICWIRTPFAMRDLSIFRWVDPRCEKRRTNTRRAQCLKFPPPSQWRQFSLREHSQSLVIPMEGSNVDVDFPSLHRVHTSASRDVLIDQRTHVFVFAVALAPQLLKRA